MKLVVNTVVVLVIHVKEAKRTLIHAHLTLYHSPGCRLLGFIEALIVKTVRHDDLVTMAQTDAEKKLHYSTFSYRCEKLMQSNYPNDDDVT